MQILEIMTKGVNFVEPDTLIPEVARRMRDEHVGMLPIAEDDRLVGVVTDRDIVVRALADGRDVDSLPAREIMSEGVHYCYEDQSAREVADQMGESHVRRLAVLDRDDRLIGMVSIGDLSQKGAASEAAVAMSEISASPPEPA